MSRVTFVPKHVAERISGQFDATISIMPPGEHADISGDYLPFNFDDTETPCGGLVMFDVEMAGELIGFADAYDDILVHCEAGMSRSAAVAKWLSDCMGYDLWLHPEGVGTDQHYNRHVYRTLNAADGRDMTAYYADLERLDRMRQR